MNLTVSWRTIAISATCCAVALAVVLAVVVVKTDVDYLSTLALALAVLAFVIQIIVFIAQAGATSQQLNRAEELHGYTLRALATIEEKAEGTRQTVNVINERMLTAVLGKVLPEAAASGIPVGSPEFSERVNQLMERTARGAETTTVRPAEGTARRSPRANFRAREDRLLLPGLPDRREVAEILCQMNEEGLRDLNRLGRDYLEYGRDSSSIGHGLRYISDGGQLYSKGLVKRIRADWDENPVWVLTGKGVQVAAVLLRDHLPDDAPSEWREARARLQQAQAKAERALLGTGSDVPVEDASEGDPS